MDADRTDLLDALAGVSEPWANMRDDDADDDDVRERDFRNSYPKSAQLARGGEDYPERAYGIRYGR